MGAIRIGSVGFAINVVWLLIIQHHLAARSPLINARPRGTGPRGALGEHHITLQISASCKYGRECRNEFAAGVPNQGPGFRFARRRGPLTTRMFTSPLFLGFDHLEQMLERASKTSSDGYPPYNIEQVSQTGLRITLAVAGFTMDDLQITQEDNQLVIRGRQTDDSQGRIFLHRGIAARQFQRSFVLAEGIEVKGAWLDNGLLHIDLAKPQPEVRVKTIPITRASIGTALRPNGTELDPVMDRKAEQ